MAFIKIENVAIRGIAACVPEHVEENIDLPVFKEGEAERVIAQTSIARKHTVEEGVTAADMCAKAFEQLVSDLNWNKETIDIIVFVTSASDYNVPPTACILQDRLGLPEETLALEVRHGCPGWVIGMSTLANHLTTGSLKRGVLLCGDTPTLLNSPKDKETRPLFGDAGTATALEFDQSAKPLEFHHGTRGKDFSAICAKYSGTRYPVTEDALKYVEYGLHQERRGIDIEMDGMGVFSFGLSTAPKSISSLCEKYAIDMESINYFIFHQANHYMNEKIRKKLKIDAQRVPYSMSNYGNTSCASIPLTIITECRDSYLCGRKESIACAFGVGLAWGSVHFTTENIVVPELIYI